MKRSGISHQSYTVDSITILPGQRYSVVVSQSFSSKLRNSSSIGGKVNANQTIDNYCKTLSLNLPIVLNVIHIYMQGSGLPKLSVVPLLMPQIPIVSVQPNDSYTIFIVSKVNGTDVYAVLHYAGASNAEPTAPQPITLPPGGVAFEEFNLKVKINHIP